MNPRIAIPYFVMAATLLAWASAAPETAPPGAASGKTGNPPSHAQSTRPAPTAQPRTAAKKTVATPRRPDRPRRAKQPPPQRKRRPNAANRNRRPGKANRAAARAAARRRPPHAMPPLPPPRKPAANGAIFPYEAAAFSTPESQIDRLVAAELEKQHLKPARPCSDEVFVRRVFLDLIGTLPEPPEVVAFLRDTRPDKRARLVDTLLARPEFADYQAMRWANLLRVKSEFPINLWPNAVQAYHHWIRQAIAGNMPFDQFARALLTSSGSNFRVPPVNFYRAARGKDPETLAAAAALTFMGTRLDSWTAPKRAEFAKLFSRIRFKPTAEWKEEIVINDPDPDTPLGVTLPDGKKIRVPAGADPRVAFADWLTAPENQWFARAYANRAWSWFFGRGIVHEPDDIRPNNPPVNPALLDFLAKQFVKSGYDTKAFFRLVTNSRTYQRSSIPQGDPEKSEKFFACYPVRRLEAEVLIDALCQITRTRENYMSAIPEPFTFIPPASRTIKLADGSITSQFLEMFGRPPRDTGLESERNNNPTDAQRLHLLNSTHIQQKLEQSWRFKNLLAANKGKPVAAIRGIYLAILSRPPERQEIQTALKYAKQNKLPLRQAALDLAWALVNSKEFLYRH